MKTLKTTWVLAALFAGAMTFLPLAACGPVKAKCSGSTCFGCCNAKDECESGASATACGSNGAMCAACPFGSLCQLGVCNNGQGAGGGTGGGTTGGGTGGSTGGGTGGGPAGGGGGTLTGDSCAAPQTLSFVNNVATVSGTTVGYTNTFSSTCANAGQPDRVFLLNQTTTGTVDINLSYTGFQPALSVHSYASGVCAMELACLVASSPGAPIAPGATTIPAGTYALVLDSQTTGGGAFTLTVTRSSATPDAGPPQVLSNGVARTISGAQSQQQYFTINVPPGTSTLTVITTGGTGDVDLFLNFGSQAVPGSATYDSQANGNDEVISVTSPTPGTWFLTTVGYLAYSGVSLTATW